MAAEAGTLLLVLRKLELGNASVLAGFSLQSAVVLRSPPAA